MYKCSAYVENKVWGYENWIVSSMGKGRSATVSECKAGAVTLLQDEVTGADYPFLLKVIQANQTLSVQVHPGNDYAAKEEGCLGKDECWLVLKATGERKLICGLKEDYTSDELKFMVEKGELSGRLNVFKVSPGDFLYLPAGTVHAICGGLRLFEVQQPSDITYRLYDWGRPRPIHIRQSLDVIHFSPITVEHPFSGEFNGRYFSLKKTFITTPTTFAPRSRRTPWGTIVVLNGGAILESGGERVTCDAEDAFLLSPSERVLITPPEGGATILEVY